MSGDLPSDIEAERFLLAAMMSQGPMAVEAACEWVAPENFYRPAHEVIFSAMIAMSAAEKPIDPVTLTAWIAGDGDLQSLGGPGAGPMYLADLMGLPVAGSVEHYGRIVLAAALRRRGIEEARRTEQALMMPGSDPDEVMARIDARLDAMRRTALSRRVPTRTFLDVTKAVAASRSPVVPGVLDAQDRVIVVAGEGRGKTTLAHQVAFCAAAGCHPFTWTVQIPPQRVMIWDFENPELELSRRFGRLGEIASGYPGWDEGNMRFELRPGGITTMRDVFELRDAVRRFAPQLLIAGPIYKMVMGGSADRDGNMLGVHNRVAQFFDELRERYGCAVWLEAHAPYGGPGVREMRPEGSALWARWPEFGLALYKASKAHGGDTALDIRRFRGDRVAGRVWPAWLTRNAYAGGWPWQANYDRDQAQLPLAPPEETG